MTSLRVVSRRLFLADLGRGALGAAVIGIGVSCSDDEGDEGDAATPAATGTATAPSAGATEAAPATAAATSTPAGSAPAGAAFEWQRVPLGFVSAYVLVRNGEAAVVDTGVEGSAGDIEAALGGLGLGWDAVGHVVVTHRHGDHAGSLDAVLASAPDALAYAGAEDIPAISSPRPLTAVGDGDRVVDLEVIATPGHTPGHIAVLDRAGGLLVAGDALTVDAGGVAGPNAQFSSDHDQAIASVRKLAQFEFATLLVGHGDPVTPNASALVAELAATL